MSPLHGASLVRAGLGGCGKSHFGEELALGSALAAEAPRQGVTVGFLAEENAALPLLPLGSRCLRGTCGFVRGFLQLLGLPAPVGDLPLVWVMLLEP